MQKYSLRTLQMNGGTFVREGRNGLGNLDDDARQALFRALNCSAHGSN